MPDLATQVGLFTGQLNGTYANATVAATATNGRTLVAVWMGLNSLSYAVDQLNAGSQTYSWAQQAILSSANAVSTDMLQIARSSAYKSAQAPPDFLVMPIPPAQTIPTFVERSGYGGISLAQIANLTSSYNAAVLNGALTLAQALAKDGRGARVFTFDIPCVGGTALGQAEGVAAGCGPTTRLRRPSTGCPMSATRARPANRAPRSAPIQPRTCTGTAPTCVAAACARPALTMPSRRRPSTARSPIACARSSTRSECQRALPEHSYRFVGPPCAPLFVLSIPICIRCKDRRATNDTKL